MKILFSPKSNDQQKLSKRHVGFKAGLTAKMIEELRQADVLEISDRLAKKGIPTDFRGNKVIAWCCNKTIQIFEQLNKKYKLKIPLPNGIYVKDFEELNIDKTNMLAFCTSQPAMLMKNSNIKTPERTIFFNDLKDSYLHATHENKWKFDWNHINEISDLRYHTKQSATDFFLDIFFNENIHSYHLSELKNKIGIKELLKIFKSVQNEEQMETYKKKYGLQVSKICAHTIESPFEAVASDMSRVIVESLNLETLMPIKNPFIGTPYEKLSFWQRVNIPNYSDEERPLNEILRNFWNGKFD